MNKYIGILILLAAIAAIRVFNHSLAVHEGRISYLPESVRTLISFNDCLLFRQDGNNPRRFVFCDSGDGGEGYLRFAIPDFDPSGCKLTLRIKARPELLRNSRMRSAREIGTGGTIVNDVATYCISFEERNSFLWSDNKCYVGVRFPKSALRPGDVVELMDFSFSRL